MMKKRWFLLVLSLVVALSVVACNSTSSQVTANKPPDSSESVSQMPPVVETTVQSTEEKPAGPCDNILYPLVSGNQWVYRVNTDDSEAATPQPEDTTDQIGISVASVEGNQAKINTLNLNTGVVTETLVECDNGAIKNFPMLNMTLIFGDQASGAAQAEYQSGIFVPSEAELSDKNWIDTWSGDYILKADFQAEDEGEQMTFSVSDSPMRLDWETQGVREAVTVPAGTFEGAVKVERTTTLQGSIKLASGGDMFQIDGTLTFGNTLWYQPGVGLLKEQVHDASVTYRGMTFPVVVTGDVELLEFRPAE